MFFHSGVCLHEPQKSTNRKRGETERYIETDSETGSGTETETERYIEADSETGSERETEIERYIEADSETDSETE